MAYDPYYGNTGYQYDSRIDSYRNLPTKRNAFEESIKTIPLEDKVAIEELAAMYGSPERSRDEIEQDAIDAATAKPPISSAPKIQEGTSLRFPPGATVKDAAGNEYEFAQEFDSEGFPTGGFNLIGEVAYGDGYGKGVVGKAGDFEMQQISALALNPTSFTAARKNEVNKDAAATLKDQLTKQASAYKVEHKASFSKEQDKIISDLANQLSQFGVKDLSDITQGTRMVVEDVYDPNYYGDGSPDVIGQKLVEVSTVVNKRTGEEIPMNKLNNAAGSGFTWYNLQFVNGTPVFYASKEETGWNAFKQEQLPAILQFAKFIPGVTPFAIAAEAALKLDEGMELDEVFKDTVDSIAKAELSTFLQNVVAAQFPELGLPANAPSMFEARYYDAASNLMSDIGEDISDIIAGEGVVSSPFDMTGGTPVGEGALSTVVAPENIISPPAGEAAGIASLPASSVSVPTTPATGTTLADIQAAADQIPTLTVTGNAAQVASAAPIPGGLGALVNSGISSGQATAQDTSGGDESTGGEDKPIERNEGEVTIVGPRSDSGTSNVAGAVSGIYNNIDPGDVPSGFVSEYKEPTLAENFAKLNLGSDTAVMEVPTQTITTTGTAPGTSSAPAAAASGALSSAIDTLLNRPSELTADEIKALAEAGVAASLIIGAVNPPKPPEPPKTTYDLDDINTRRAGLNVLGTGVGAGIGTGITGSPASSIYNTLGVSTGVTSGGVGGVGGVGAGGIGAIPLTPEQIQTATTAFNRPYLGGQAPGASNIARPVVMVNPTRDQASYDQARQYIAENSAPVSAFESGLLKGSEASTNLRRGGIAALYKGGAVNYQTGGPIAYMGGGMTAPVNQPRMLSGGGDGMSDSIPATIDGVQPARLADGEFVVPADVVADIGNGSSSAGAKQLYAMMDRVRQSRHGTTKQPPEVNMNKVLPV